MLEKLVEERLPWAERRLADKAAEFEKRGLPKTYRGGETFPLLGCEHQLVVVESDAVKRSRCDYTGERFFIETAPGPEPETEEPVREALFKWYKREAKRDILERVAVWAPVIGRGPVTVSIRNQRARWGSCSVKGSINFNWRLLMAPPEIIDYVVVHELCHLIEHNHSSAYWTLVERILPDYKTRRRQLRELGYLLEIS